MKIKIKNLGILRHAEFSMSDLTIICGENNTGKTYATYGLYGFLKNWRQLIQVDVGLGFAQKLMKSGKVDIDLSRYEEKFDYYIQQASERYKKLLPEVFASSEKFFEDSSIEISIEKKHSIVDVEYGSKFGSSKEQYVELKKKKGQNFLAVELLVREGSEKLPFRSVMRLISDSIKDILYGGYFPDPFIASAERTGAAIFLKELDFSRNRLLDEITSGAKNLDPLSFLERNYSGYALPVEDNVNFTRRIDDFSKSDGLLYKKDQSIISDFSSIIGGEYKTSKNDGLLFIPNSKRVKLTMHQSSSAVRSMLDIGFYLRHVAKPGDLLIIDEPELNLHPANQKKVARLFARLINHGVKVFITTHSDYIIKELNTLIMLSSGEERMSVIAEREGYRKDELVDFHSVGVYIAKDDLVLPDGGKKRVTCPTLVPADIDPIMGIEAESFDKTIEDMNRIQDEIVWGGEA